MTTNPLSTWGVIPLHSVSTRCDCIREKVKLFFFISNRSINVGFLFFFSSFLVKPLFFNFKTFIISTRHRTYSHVFASRSEGQLIAKGSIHIDKSLAQVEPHAVTNGVPVAASHLFLAIGCTYVRICYACKPILCVSKNRIEIELPLH